MGRQREAAIVLRNKVLMIFKLESFPVWNPVPFGEYSRLIRLGAKGACPPLFLGANPPSHSKTRKERVKSS
jgi:hypothetical protein